jgi:hypothetical protein
MKNEDNENHAINHPAFSNQQFEIVNYPKKENSDEVLERETRGVDFRGNVRYFCPKCNVSVDQSRYFDQIKLIFYLILFFSV